MLFLHHVLVFTEPTCLCQILYTDDPSYFISPDSCNQLYMVMGISHPLKSANRCCCAYGSSTMIEMSTTSNVCPKTAKRRPSSRARPVFCLSVEIGLFPRARTVFRWTFTRGMRFATNSSPGIARHFSSQFLDMGHFFIA